MNVQIALEKRKSVRVFLDKAVEVDKINAILSSASHSPSGLIHNRGRLPLLWATPFKYF
jgi:nitroreductase